MSMMAWAMMAPTPMAVMTENTMPSFVPCRSRARRSVNEATWSGLGLLGMFTAGSISWLYATLNVAYFALLDKPLESPPAHCTSTQLVFIASDRQAGAVWPPAHLPLTPSPSVAVFRGGFIEGAPTPKNGGQRRGRALLVLGLGSGPSRLSQREPVRGRVAY